MALTATAAPPIGDLANNAADLLAYLKANRLRRWAAKGYNRVIGLNWWHFGDGKAMSHRMLDSITKAKSWDPSPTPERHEPAALVRARPLRQGGGHAGSNIHSSAVWSRSLPHRKLDVEAR